MKTYKTKFEIGDKVFFINQKFTCKTCGHTTNVQEIDSGEITAISIHDAGLGVEVNYSLNCGLKGFLDETEIFKTMRECKKMLIG